MWVPGSNLLFVGGVFIAGWFSGRYGFNRNEDGYLKAAREKVAAHEAAMAAAPPEAVAAELAAINATEEANKKDD